VAWTAAEERYGGARTVLLSHVVADAGLMVALLALVTEPPVS
jgi:hypothetical protein